MVISLFLSSHRLTHTDTFSHFSAPNIYNPLRYIQINTSTVSYNSTYEHTCVSGVMVDGKSQQNRGA